MSYVSPTNSKLLYGTKPNAAADGVSRVAVKARLRNEKGEFVAGRMVEFVADREGVLITQPTAPTGPDGLAIGFVAAVTPGPVNISAFAYIPEASSSSEAAQ